MQKEFQHNKFLLVNRQNFFDKDFRRKNIMSGIKKIRLVSLALMLILSFTLSACASSVVNTSTTSSDTETAVTEALTETTDAGSNTAADTSNETETSSKQPAGTPPEGMGEPPEGGQPGGEPPEGMGMPPGGGGGTVETGTGAYLLSDGEALKSGTYTSTNDDENAIRAEGEISASLTDVNVEKTEGSASNNDASSFYGLNAAVLALDGATLDISGGTVTATAEGANGVFAYNNATINISDTVINVSGGNAGGIEVAGGGIMYASNLTVNATVKAAIRSDRGGGTLVVDGGTYTTSGSSGAPAVYSTADITVSNATLTANDSEAVVVEGFNSVTLVNCDVMGNMNSDYADTNGENIHNVMLYQSMSGDAEVGTSSFTMTGGTLTALSGDMFYITNTSSIINLSGVDLTLANGTYLLVVAGNNSSRGWGTEGANGGNVVFNLFEQTLVGDITVDSISTLGMAISNSSSFTGSFNADGSEASALTLTLDETSTWTLTADSYLTSFSGSLDNVNTNGYTLYVNGTAMN